MEANSNMSAMDYFRKGLELYESERTPPAVEEAPTPAPEPAPPPPKRKVRRTTSQEDVSGRSKSVNLWREVLALHREKHGLKGIPKRGTKEHVRVVKDYEKALRRAAKAK